MNQKKPLIIAHRGGLAEVPENTMRAFAWAFQHGADGIEFDVQLTRDGCLLIHHDETLSRIPGIDDRASNRDYSELQTADWGRWHHPRFAGEPPVTLKDVLSTFNGDQHLLVEIKSFAPERKAGNVRALTEAVVAMCETVTPGSRVYILSFDLDALAHAHSLNPALQYVYNVNLLLPGADLPEWLYAWSANVSGISAAWVERAHRAGADAWTWSCNTPAQVAHALRVGVDLLMTDRPSWIQSYFARYGGNV